MLKTADQLKTMQHGGALLADFLRQLKFAVKPGIATLELESLAAELIHNAGVSPSFLNYNNYPAILCTSINEQIVHGLPSERILEIGDLLKIDCGIKYQGLHVDSAFTVIVGEDNVDSKILEKIQNLVRVTKEALFIGIKEAQIDKTVGDIGSVIQKYVESQGFNVVRELVGHGVGTELHESPEVPNYGRPGTGAKLMEGMTIAIEPMVVSGSYKIEDGEDGFSIVTADKSLAAHFEHTIAVTKNGPIILTNMNNEQ